MNSFAPYSSKNTSFIIKNVSNKRISVFGYPIQPNFSIDLLAMPGVSEESVRASLLKGELNHKLLTRDITILFSDVDLTQFNEAQKLFLQSSGITTGLTTTAPNITLYPSIVIDGYTSTNVQYALTLLNNKSSPNATNVSLSPSLTIDGYVKSNVQDAIATLKDLIISSTDMSVGNFTTTNLDPISPAVVRYTILPKTHPINGVNETTSIYHKMDHSSSDYVIGIYGEVDESQSHTGGSFTKVIHMGKGDAHYVAIMGPDGYAPIGYEAATYSDSSIGFLSSAQKSGLGNCKMFNALWEQDTLLNYGAFYAEDIPNNSFVIRKRSGAPNGYAQFSIHEYDLSRTRVEIFNEGRVDLSSLLATSGDQLKESPELHLIGAYWDTGTSSSKDMSVILKNVVTATDTNELRIYVGNPLSPTLAGSIYKTTGTGTTGLAIIVDTGSVSVKQILVGDADSGGSGYRLLRIAN